MYLHASGRLTAICGVLYMQKKRGIIGLLYYWSDRGPLSHGVENLQWSALVAAHDTRDNNFGSIL